MVAAREKAGDGAVTKTVIEVTCNSERLPKFSIVGSIGGFSVTFLERVPKPLQAWVTHGCHQQTVTMLL